MTVIVKRDNVRIAGNDGTGPKRHVANNVTTTTVFLVTFRDGTQIAITGCDDKEADDFQIGVPSSSDTTDTLNFSMWYIHTSQGGATLKVHAYSGESLGSVLYTFTVPSFAVKNAALQFNYAPSTGVLAIVSDTSSEDMEVFNDGTFATFTGSPAFTESLAPLASTVFEIAALAASTAEGQSGSTAFTFTVTRSGDTSGTASVAYAVTGSDAAPASAADFASGVLPSGTVSFAANQTSQTITVNVAGDTAVEANEGFTVTLSAPSTGATLGTATASGTIVNDDASLSIAALEASTAEGQSGSTALTFTVTRSGDTSVAHSAQYVVAGSGAASANAADFVGNALPSGTVSFTANQTSQTITVNVAGDTTLEANEGFIVTLSAPSIGARLGTATATGTILNDDGALLSIAALAASKAEGQSGSTAFTFTVTRSGDTSGAHSAKYAVTGSGADSATAADFAGGVLPGGTVSFTAGQTSQTVTVNVAGNTTVEADEGFTVTLSAPSTGAMFGTATATGTIVNDDALLSIAALAASKAEGQSGSTALTFTVTRSGDTSVAHSAQYVVAGSGAAPASGADFDGGVLPGGTVNFGIGEESKDITVNVAGDTMVEANEGFTVTLSAPSTGATLGTATARGTIVNDDASLSIAALAANKAEGQSGYTAFTFIVTRSGDTSVEHSAQYAVFGIGAAPASAADFVGSALPSGTVSFTAGQTSQTITVNVAGDTTVEANEGFAVTLSAPSTGARLGTTPATGTIVNDDGALLSIAARAASKAEGQSGGTAFTFTVTRSGDTSVAHSAKYAVTGSGSGAGSATAADFVGNALPGGTVSFAADETSQTITVNVAGDTMVEANEGFTVTLSAPSTGARLGSATATGTIVNDDASLSIAALAASKAEGESGSTAFTFTVTRSGDTSVAHSAKFAVTGSGAAPASAADFAGGFLPGGTVNFAANATSQIITVNVAGDTAMEADEGFTIILSKPSIGATLGTATAAAVIINDDFVSTVANQTLTGTEGSDVFMLGGGLDVVWGRGGLDGFRFQQSAIGRAGSNATTFEDFSRAFGEKLDLSRIDAIAGTFTNDAFSFIGTAAFNGTPGQLRWEDQGSVRLIQGNVNNDTIADLTIFVKAAGPVEANWFVL